jgi:hypothetical protein
MRVTGQEDSIFSGQMFFRAKNGSEWNKTFAGVIDRDGRTLTIVEHGGGHDSGSLISQDGIELIYVDPSTPFMIAIDSLKRS